MLHKPQNATTTVHWNLVHAIVFWKNSTFDHVFLMVEMVFEKTAEIRNQNTNT